MMKPLSERIKSFSADQFIDWLCLACVDVREVRTEEDAQAEINTIRSVVKERLSALEQESQKNLDGALAWQRRAEAAEAKIETALRAVDNLDAERNVLRAKLKEWAEQEPVAYWHHSGQVVTREECHDDKIFAICCKVERPLFIRPAPAINLADLVPNPSDNKYWRNDGYGTRFNVQTYHGDVLAILRNIEEQSQ